MFTKSKGRPKGQVAVIFTVAVPVLIGVLAMCCDMTVTYLNWQAMQKAADAAVLAGANYLPTDPATAISTANTWAQQNGMASSEILSTSVAPDDMSITMTAKRAVPAYFARIFGTTSVPVQVAATAGVENSSSAIGLVPIGVNCASGIVSQCFGYLQPVTLKNSQIGPGNWGPLALGANGASTYRTNIEQGYQGSISIGQWISSETGNVVGPTSQGFNARWSEYQQMDPTGTASSHSLSDPLVVEVPLVNWGSPNGKSQVQVTGFADFWITGVQGSGNVTGEFLHEVAPSANSASATAPEGGALVPVLLK
jgi:Putative Flp pilus-assembly TadE/G-like